MSHWRFRPDAPADKFRIGTHRTAIAWEIPDASPGAPSGPPVGTQIGLRHTCESYYPKAEDEAGIEGTTLVRFTITTDGETRDASVEQSSGNSNLDAAAIQCVRIWRYTPAIVEGKPVAVPWKAKVVWKRENFPPFAEPPRDCLRSYPVKTEDIANIDGTTEVAFKIVRGLVQDVTVTHSSGNAALDRAAVACIGSRRYQRQTITAQDGVVVDKWQSITARERVNWGDALKAGN